MNSISTRKRHLGRGCAPILVLAGLLLASCGSSSHKTATTTKTSSSPLSVHVGSVKVHALPFSACLKKNGITASGGVTAGRPTGVSKSRYEQVLKKCGLTFSDSKALEKLPKTSHINGATVDAQLKKFAACMRQHGVSFPEPNAPGSATTFKTKALNTKSKTFRAAEAACISDLRGKHSASPGAKTTG